MPIRIEEPWLSFLIDVDQALKEPIEVHCLGGFVLSILCGLPRYTGDVDFIEVRPATANDKLLEIAGEGSELGKRNHLHFHRVTVAAYPESYESRLIDITPREFQHLKLRALEVHDVVLAKVARNNPRDRADVEFLAEQGVLDRKLLTERFEHELCPHLLNKERGVRTLELWLEEFLGETLRTS